MEKRPRRRYPWSQAHWAADFDVISLTNQHAVLHQQMLVGGGGGQGVSLIELFC